MAYGTLTTDVAWLLGLIAGDGGVNDHHLDITFGPEHDMPMAREAERVLRMSGWPVSSINIKMVPKQPPRQPCLVLFAYGTALVDEIRQYSTFGLQDWRVPELVLYGPAEVQGAWIAGLTDADGHVQHIASGGKRNVSIDSTNLAGLDQVAAMLSSLGVGCRRYSHDRQIENYAAQHKIHVCDRTNFERFAAVVPLRCPRKQKTMQEALLSYQRDILTRSEVDALVPRLEQMLREKQPYTTIADELGITADQVRNIVRTRELDGPGRGHGAKHLEIEALLPLVHERLAAGETLAEIGASLGLSEHTLPNAFQKRGLKVGKRAGPFTKRMRELDALVPQLRELVAEGLSKDAIAEILGHGLNEAGVARLQNKHGITRRGLRGTDKPPKEPTAP